MTAIPASPQGRAVASDARTAAFLIRDLLGTRELRQAITFLIPELLNLWAGRNSLKKMVARPLEKVICDGVRPPDNERCPSLLDEEMLAGRLEALLPLLSSVLFDVADTVGRGMENLTPEKQEKVLSACISSLTTGRSGEMIARLGRMIGRIHQRNPRFVTEALQPGFQRWMESIDFGELRETLDRSAAETAAFATMINDVLWRYPAKLVLALSCLPDLANAGGVILRESLGRFNQVSPDLVADIVLSLLRHLDGAVMGKCIQEAADLIHKVHTGSALIGDPGVPQFVQDLKKLAQETAAGIDGVSLAKARKALAEDREVIGRVMTDTLKARPELWHQQLRQWGELKNPGLRAARHRLSSLEEFSGDSAVEAMADGITELDIQEAAELVNLVSRIVSRLQTARPQTLTMLATQFTEGLDLFEVTSAVENAAAVLGDSLAPAGRAILPPLLRTVGRWMQPADDEFEDEMRAARATLRRLLTEEEVTP
ncbi:MAG: hypothetical protein ACOZF0_05045 [Thermodesulfobacteriota bacterium]